ncbi:hypothetical protein BJV82DRAFT_603538 [Fennellomyces sp. T-0311]|nr:hypothetical protein BJV82DRAFT_603538 [Fennellomyces sp. T-0311]
MLIVVIAPCRPMMYVRLMIMFLLKWINACPTAPEFDCSPVLIAYDAWFSVLAYVALIKMFD